MADSAGAAPSAEGREGPGVEQAPVGAAGQGWASLTWMVTKPQQTASAAAGGERWPGQGRGWVMSDQNSGSEKKAAVEEKQRPSPPIRTPRSEGPMGFKSHPQR